MNIEGELVMRNEKILLVDDEQGILEIYEVLLRKEGYRHIKKASNGQEALASIQASEYDLIVLDVMLPDIEGFQLCNQIRQYTQIPILFVTARSSDLDMLTGLAIGGDDYITKPFNPLELMARINAQLRRHGIYVNGNSMKPTVWDYGSLLVKKDEGQVSLRGEDVHLTAKEFELLIFFCKYPNRIFTVNQLYENVWNDASFGDEKTVVMHISKLRRKIEVNHKNPEIIINLKGIGYKFVPPTRGKIE